MRRRQEIVLQLCCDTISLTSKKKVRFPIVKGFVAKNPQMGVLTKMNKIYVTSDINKS